MSEPADQTFRHAAPGEITVRLLGAGDVDASMSLKEQANWNQTEEDWRRLLALEPRGCFAAVSATEGKLVGTATTTTYVKELAWVGMVLVDRDYRRRGVATRLMNAALDYLRDREIKTVKLDATPEGAFVYESLGFAAELTVERWSAEAATARNAGKKADFDRSAPPGEATLDEILEFDRIRFGADRSELLRNLIGDAPLAPLIQRAEEADDRLTGYALIRRGSRANYLGPVVADDPGAARNLITKALESLPGETIYVDVNTIFKSFREILAGSGFVKQRELVRMWRGEKCGSASGGSVLAAAGLEVG